MMTTLHLYSRRGCHLCERLEEELQPLIAGRARIETIDIDTDIDLKKRYGLRVPVLAARERELSGYPLEHDVVEQYLSGLGGDIADPEEMPNTLR